MKRWPRSRARYKGLPWLIFTMFVGVSVFEALTLYYVREQLIASTGETLALAAADIADKLDLFLYERYLDIQVLARVEVFRSEDRAAKVDHLNKVRAAYPVYLSLTLIDPQGRVVASTDAARIGQDRSGSAWFAAARDRAGVQVRDAPASQDGGGTNAALFASAIRGPAGEFRGVVAVETGLPEMEAPFENTVRAFRAQRGQGEIEWNILARDGRVIHSSVGGAGASFNSKAVGLLSVLALESNRIGYVEETRLPRQTPVVTGYARCKGHREFPGLGWGVLVRVNRSDIFAAMHRILWRFGLAGALLAGMLLVFVVWSTRRLHTDWAHTVESEQRLVTTLRSIGEAFLATDSAGRVTMMNGVAQQLTGWSESDALGRPLDEVFRIQQPATQEPRESPFAGALRGDAPAAAPDYATLVARGGGERLTFQSVAPIRNAVGEVSGVVLVARDVTERLRAVEALRTTMRRLEQQSAALAKQARNPALLGSDLPTALRTITEVAARTLEVKRASVWFYTEDRSKILCADLFEKDTERHSTGMELAASENSAYFRALAEERGIAVRDARSDSRTHELAGRYLEPLGIFSMLAAPIGAGGKMVGVVCHEQTNTPREWTLDEQSFAGSIADLVALSFEVCRRRQAEAALRDARDSLERKVDERTRDLAEANERLQELDRLKSEFLATMSHELRTPLNSIIGFTGIMRQELAGPLNDEQKKQLGMVQSAGRHLLGLINDLLDLSRIESGKLQVARERFKIASVVEEVGTSLAPLVAQKRLRFETELDDPALELCSDRKKCFQILLNLANNAVKFTQQGEVRIRVASSPERVTIVVSDTGIGIKPGSMAHLFEAFRQVDGSARRVYEGTGLGLYLCKKLTSLLGGKIRAESEFGAGSRFTVTFPRETAEATI